MAMRSYLDDYLGQDEGQEIGRNIDAYMQHEDSNSETSDILGLFDDTDIALLDFSKVDAADLDDMEIN